MAQLLYLDSLNSSEMPSFGGHEQKPSCPGTIWLSLQSLEILFSCLLQGQGQMAEGQVTEE